MLVSFRRLTLWLFLALPSLALAEGAQFAFGNMQRDGALPVEVTADKLDVDQTDGTAVFSGNVLIGQGEMRLSAPRVQVFYKKDRSGIERLLATGGVTLVSGEDAAEAERADYNIDTGQIVLSGNVLLVQGGTAISAENVVVDTRSGTARMTGRVKTVLQQGAPK